MSIDDRLCFLELTFLMINSSRCLRRGRTTRRTIAENLHHLFYRMESTKTDALTEALAFKKLPYVQGSITSWFYGTHQAICQRFAAWWDCSQGLPTGYIDGEALDYGHLRNLIKLVNIGMGCGRKPVEIQLRSTLRTSPNVTNLHCFLDFFGEPHDWDSSTHIDVWN